MNFVGVVDIQFVTVNATTTIKSSFDIHTYGLSSNVVIKVKLA